mmetsp:Transcript_26548/g.41650  ORF Transcript_26548/g.41650 Transcript_26548/m.41650 type:complete len:347 (+) Transcript_26548:105-1145(+)
MLHRRVEKKNDPPTANGNNGNRSQNKDKVLDTEVSAAAHSKQGLLLKIFPYVIIFILCFDRFRYHHTSSCHQHLNPEKVTSVSTSTATATGTAYDSNNLRLGGKQEVADKDNNNNDDILLVKGEMLTEMQAMDWEIPIDIKEERHKECDGQKTSSTGGFCLTMNNHIGGNWLVDTALGNHLRDNVFNGMSVVDLGAGLGHYGKIFREEGSPVKSWVGFDGAMNVERATDGLVRFMDLTQPHPADERPCVNGDWVLSLEVAEHIPPQFTDHFIRNLRCSCTVGAVVSWAVPSQRGGLGHVNCKEQKDAIAAMERWGFVVDREATEAAQAAASMSHFKRNTLVFQVKK